MWSCRGFLISGHSQHSRWSDLVAGTLEDAVVLETSSSSFLLYFESLCYTFFFVCAAGNFCSITSTPDPEVNLQTLFLDLELPRVASESLLMPFISFSTERCLAKKRFQTFQIVMTCSFRKNS